MIARLKQWASEPTITPFMIKAFVVTVAATALLVPLAIVAIPYIEFFNDMAVQYKVKPQMAWTHTEPGGQAVPGDRQSVPGTIPRNHYPYPYADTGPDAGAEGAASVGKELTLDNPLLAWPYRPPEPTLYGLERGQRLYESFCIPCHGPYGLGDGEVSKRGFPAPPSLLDDRVRDYSLGHLFHVQTMGQNAMPSYALQLSPEDRWAIAYYVRALHKAFPHTSGPAPSTSADAGINAPSVAGDAAAQATGSAPSVAPSEGTD